MRNEMVLYYSPAPRPYVAKLKGVLVRMGVRIRNLGTDQVNQRVGYLAGMPGFEEEHNPSVPLIEDEVLVMKNFTSRRIDELLMNLRKAGVPKIALKAVITEQNSKWTFYQLYEELKEEHTAMSGLQQSQPQQSQPQQGQPQQGQPQQSQPRQSQLQQSQQRQNQPPSEQLEETEPLSADSSRQEKEEA